jgi:uncharacterized protein
VVEGALVRYLTRVGERAETALHVLRALHALPACEFWPDDVSYLDADLTAVRGHRQVTDAHLVSLAARHPGGILATLDEALVGVARGSTLLLPGHRAQD